MKRGGTKIVLWGLFFTSIMLIQQQPSAAKTFDINPQYYIRDKDGLYFFNLSTYSVRKQRGYFKSSDCRPTSHIFDDDRPKLRVS